jgi:hypothetical protein
MTILAQTFKDRSKLVLLAFLIPVVDQLEKINAMFQLKMCKHILYISKNLELNEGPTRQICRISLLENTSVEVMTFIMMQN